MKKYIEPRLRRDFGGIIAAYFDFLKANFKGIVNAFVGYNGVFVIFILTAVYFLVTGFIAAIISQSNSLLGTSSEDETALMITGAGFIFLIIVLLIATLFNYGLSSAYVSLYEKRKKHIIPRQDAWEITKKNLGGLFLVSLVAIGVYIIYVIVQMVLGFIPIIGSLASIVIGLGFNAWISLSVFSYIHNDEMTVGGAFGEAWDLLFSNFWKAIGVNFVLGLIINVAIIALSILPSVLVGIYVYHSVENTGGFEDDIFGHILLVVLITLFCLIGMFTQLLSQSINAFLYFNLHEFKNNVYLHSRIEKLGTTS